MSYLSDTNDNARRSSQDLYNAASDLYKCLSDMLVDYMGYVYAQSEDGKDTPQKVELIKQAKKLLKMYE